MGNTHAARLGSVFMVMLLLESCGGRTTGAVAVPSSAGNTASSAMMQMPKSISPALIPAPPMAQTPPQSAAAMTSQRRPASDVSLLGFTQLPGAGVFVAASPDGSIWVLSTQGGPVDKSIYHYVNGTWTNIPGAAMRLAVGPDNTLWAVNSSGGIYRYQNGAWSTIAGGASDIAVGSDGSVYVISSVAGGQYGNGIWHYVNGTWTQLPGAGVRIAASWDTGSYSYNVAPGGFYVVNAQLSIFYWNPQLGFTQLPGAAIQAAPTTNGGLFVLGVPTSSNGNPIYYNNLVTGAWTQQAGAGVSIATNSSNVYVIGAAGGIYYAPVTAPISIDAQSPALATVNKDVFGVNLSSSMNLTNANSNYSTMITTFRNARFGMVRWPLALLSDYYHWQTNSFSSCAVSAYGSQGLASRTTFDQFMQQVAQPLGLDINVTINYGSNANCTGGGDPNEAAAWVDYANNQMHYGIKYWTIGNEQYFGDPTLGATPTTPDFNVPVGAPGALGSATYANLIATKFYPLMKAKDPTIQIGVNLVVLENNVSSRASPWDSTVLANAKFDFVEVHWYGASAANVAIGDTALLTAGRSYFVSALAQLRSELAAAGKPNTPIYVGEWGVPGPNGGSPQSVTIVGALFTALALGELIKGGTSMAGVWEGFDSGPCVSSPAGFYTWQSWYTSSLFEAIPGGTNPACPSIAQPPLGTAFPRASAMQVVQQAFLAGDTVFAPTVSSSLATVKAYGAKRANGYGVLLINTDPNNSVTTTLGIVNDSRTFTVTNLLYSKEQYDTSRNNIWTTPVSQTLGSATGSLPVTLPPWSVAALTLTSSSTSSLRRRGR